MARTPTNILKLKGAHKKNPARFIDRENEPVNTKPLRDPPEHLKLDEQEAYKEIVLLTIPGVLGEADSLAVEEAARLLVICRGQRNDPPMAAERRLLFCYFGQLGMLPADRSKISVPQPKKKNKFDDC